MVGYFVGQYPYKTIHSCIMSELFLQPKIVVLLALACFIIAAAGLFLMRRRISQSNGIRVSDQSSTPSLSRWQQWQVKREMQMQAGQLYTTARGTQHKTFLQDGQDRVQARLKSLKQQLDNQADKLDRFKSARKKKIEDYWAVKIVNSRLMEVPGIGPTRRYQLMEHFDGTLDSLFGADKLVNGIGHQTAYVLNNWIIDREEEIEGLIMQPFAGRAELIADDEKEIAALEKSRKSLKKQVTRFEKLATEIKHAIEPLEKVSKERFVAAYLGQEAWANDYVQGVFAEWEPVPDWFQEMMQL